MDQVNYESFEKFFGFKHFQPATGYHSFRVSTFYVPPVLVYSAWRAQLNWIPNMWSSDAAFSIPSVEFGAPSSSTDLVFREREDWSASTLPVEKTKPFLFSFQDSLFRFRTEIILALHISFLPDEVRKWLSMISHFVPTCVILTTKVLAWTATMTTSVVPIWFCFVTFVSKHTGSKVRWLGLCFVQNFQMGLCFRLLLHC